MSDQKKKNDFNENKENSKEDNTLLRSTEVQEIISSKPGFLEKWAVKIFILLFITCIASLSLIRFKNSIELNGTLKAKEHATEIVCNNDGIIKWLPKIQDGKIKEGQLIASLVDSIHYIHASLILDKIGRCVTFIQKKDYEKGLKLLTNLPPLPTDLDFNYTNILLLKKKFLNRLLRIGSMQQNDSSSDPKLLLLNKLSLIYDKLSNWIRTHAILSPTHGRIKLIQPLYLGQRVTKDSSLGYVDPLSKVIYAESYLTPIMYQKVRLGQIAHFHLQNLSELKDGDLLGRVNYISPISKNNSYLIIIGFISMDKNSLIVKLTDGTPVNFTIDLNSSALVVNLYYSVSKYISSI